MTKCLFVFCFLFLTEGYAKTPAIFPSYHAAADYPLDPNPNSSFWKVKGVALDRSVLGQPEPALASEARSRWTDKYVYFLFFGPYQTLHLHPHPDTVHETPRLWFYDDFELDLGSNFKNINLYHEFQISPQSEWLDQPIDASQAKPGWGDVHLWNSGMQVKSRIDRVKKIWYGEMRIPLAAIEKRKPVDGLEMRVNVYRLQSAPKGRPKVHFLAWQPTGEWTPHRPKKFGLLKFVGAPADTRRSR